MTIQLLNNFDSFEYDNTSKVYQIFPKYFNDHRGYFMEVMNFDNQSSKVCPNILKRSSYIKQVNRSSSNKCVFRGFHAQTGRYCQGKLVEAVTETVYDIIIDARPNSKTFGSSTIIKLSSETHNKLWVPRGFLHSFLVPYNIQTSAIFEYFCDNNYKKESEITINPETVLPSVINEFKILCEKTETLNIFDDLFDTFYNHKIIYSDKDLNVYNYVEFMEKISKDFETNNKLWYENRS